MSSETIEKDSKRKARAAEEAEAREDERDEEDEEDERDEDERDEDDDEEEESGSREPVDVGPSEKVVIDRPSSAKMVWTLASREIGGYVNSAITYIVIAVSLIGIGLYFFFYKGGFWQVDRASMARMFDALPVALCFLTIPLFTMRSLSDEKRVGTIELLITMPVKDSEVILGKFIGAFAMVSLQVLLLAAYPLVMFSRAPFWHLGEFDWSPFWVGMLGLFLLSMAGTAVGVMWSSFTESQILSYFATMLTLVALYALGSVTIVEFLQGWPGDAISFISLQSRFEPFARGLIDTRALIYFISLTVLCLMVAFRSLESRKWS
ncbi:MAG: ABC transporter permease [Labilithrix sp.]|nr:ABC transporter permease [Labilithrix sp.]